MQLIPQRGKPTTTAELLSLRGANDYTHVAGVLPTAEQTNTTGVRLPTAEQTNTTGYCQLHVPIPRSDTRSGDLSTFTLYGFHPSSSWHVAITAVTASIPRRSDTRLPSLGVAILALVNCLGKQRTAGKTYRRVNAQTESTQNEQIQQSTRREAYATINRVGATFAIGDARMAMLVWRCG